MLRKTQLAMPTTSRIQAGAELLFAARVEDEILACFDHLVCGQRQSASLDERLAAGDADHTHLRPGADRVDDLPEELEVGDRRAVRPRVDRAVRAAHRAPVGDEQQHGATARLARRVDLGETQATHAASGW